MTEKEFLIFLDKRRKDKRIFSVSFVKRTTSEVRHMNRCQFGVTKHLKGGEPAYDPGEHGLVWVYDHDAMARDGSVGDYRSFPIDGVFQCRINGTIHRVKHPKKAKK